MKLFIKIFLIALIALCNAQPGYAAKKHKASIKVAAAITTNSGYTANPWVALKRSGANDFYFCGNVPTTKIFTLGTGKANDGSYISYNKRYSHTHTHQHGQCISLRDDYKELTRHFCCCEGGGTTMGSWVDVTNLHSAHPTWGLFRGDETGANDYDTKTFGNDTCKQTYYLNVCSADSRVKSVAKFDYKGTNNSTYAHTILSSCSPCGAGQVRRHNSCVAACPDGQGFKPGTNTCITCPSSLRQGILGDPDNNDTNGDCAVCASTQFYNKGTQKCVDFSSMIQVSVNAHNDCWLCGSAGSMYECFKRVTRDGSLEKITGDKANQLRSACSLTGTDDGTLFSLPEGAVAIIDDGSGSTTSVSDTTTDTTTSNSTSTTWTLSDGSVCNGNPNGFHTCTRPDGSVTAAARRK
ncbi:MAG: hypothetical protein J5608_02305 [Alphaproteobacteria bacterium]|nr:hypothetical protein [Alphaproteobacteria bacterium]